MGFIDWLTKDSSNEVKEKQAKVIEKEVEQDDEELDEELDSLRKLANDERKEIAEFDDNEEDDVYTPIENNYFESQIQQFNSAPNASFTIFKVSDEEDVRQVLKHLTTNSPCIATFENLRKKEFALIMKYLQGGTFVLGANMSEWQKDAYIIVPKGMTINMQEKSRRR